MLLNQLIRTFSTRQSVPVQTEEVLEVLKAWGVRDDVWFFSAPMNTSVVKGQFLNWESPWDDGKTKRFADIYTAAGLSNAEKRLVQCKELLHLLDADWALVNTRPAILDLIQKIVVLPELQDPFGEDMHHANSDRGAMIHALAILFPWEVRQMLLPKYKEGKLTIKQIAEEIIDLPETYVAVVMNDVWEKIYGMMTGVQWAGFSTSRAMYRVVRHTYKEGQLSERAALSGHDECDTAILAAGKITRNGGWQFQEEDDRWSTTDEDGRLHHIMVESY
ncbi:MAG: hypothetical protein WAN65_23560 [Candidatus Sulfotelmatobacter sp.]